MKLSALIICLLTMSACAAAPEGGEVDATEPDVTRGIYASAFEASILHPCEEPEALWWLSANMEFAEQYSSLWGNDSEFRGVPGRYVFVRMNGELTEEGHYGHLGGYNREFTVTELIEMRAIDTEPEGDLVTWVSMVCEQVEMSD